MEDSLQAAASAAEEVEVVDSKTLTKTDYFIKEIDYIKNDRIKESAKILINYIPDYFFHEAASSTGKYHPSFSQGEGGLLRHTKVAVKIAKTILSNPTFSSSYTDTEIDLIYLALILHDSVKRGNNEKYTRFDHPILASNLVEEKANLTKLTREEIELLKSMILTHMGPWVTDYHGKEVLEKPKTKCQKLVHLCDYLSAQKFLDVKFNGNEIMF